MASQLPLEAQQYLRFIRDNAQQMDRLIQDLLALSRSSYQPLHKQPVDVVALVREVLEKLREEQPGRQVEVAIAELPGCQADPALLRQVWVNLLGNALKYTRQCNPAQVKVGSRVADAESVFFVQDNGAGFDMKYADKLFGVFQRLHRADEFEGTGIGLAIVQRIVNRHGGRVWAEAKIHEGATFFFTLGEGAP